MSQQDLALPAPSILAQVAAGPPPDLVAAWLEGRKPTTIAEYAKDLALFARFLGGPTNPTAQTLDFFLGIPANEAHQVALTYKHAMKSHGLATATVARRLASLRSFVDFANQVGKCTYLLRLDADRIEARRDVKGPDRAELAKLLATVASLGPTKRERRDRAIFALLFGLGLRRAEVCGIDIDEYDPANRRIRVLGKGRAERDSLHVPGPVATALEGWLIARGHGPGPLFSRTDRASTEPLTGDAIERIVGRLGRRAGLARKLTPHMLRHAAITLLRSGGKTTRQAAAFSRHLKEETVHRYDDRRGEDHRAMAEIVASHLE